DFRFEVALIHRLNLACNLQRETRLLRHFNREMRAFYRRESSNETQIWLLIGLQPVVGEMDPMMNRCAVRHRLERALKVADCHVVHLREVGVEVAQRGLVWMMDSVDNRLVYKARACQTRSVVEVNDVAIASCVSHRPSCVIYVFQAPENFAFERPL